MANRSMQASHPLVSVIVPTYNRPLLLARALSSINQQMFDGYEVIVVNDGGDDVRDVVSSYPQVIYLHHAENKGLPAARNTALNAARGVYVAYLDDDDWFYSDHLSTLVLALSKGIRAAYTDAYKVNGPEWMNNPNTRESVYMSFDYDRELLRCHNLFPVCCAMHEKSLIEEVGGFDESLENHEDWDLWQRIGDVTDFVHIPRVTCVVDRSRPTMMDNRPAMLAGFELVRSRYAAGVRLEQK